MLAQNFMIAADLRITEPQKRALIKTLVLLETGKLQHVHPDATFSEPRGFTGHFNMSWWDLHSGCGTICCIGGTAELIGELKPNELDIATIGNSKLRNLFYPGVDKKDQIFVAMQNITPTQAAVALRSYLTTGDAQWNLAVSS